MATEPSVTVGVGEAMRYLDSVAPSIAILRKAGLLDEDDLERLVAKLRGEMRRRLTVAPREGGR